MIPESSELRDEQFWRAGGGFHWCWPMFDRLQCVDKTLKVGLNRYPHNIIGAYASFRGRGLGVRWKGSYPRAKYRQNKARVKANRRLVGVEEKEGTND